MNKSEKEKQVAEIHEKFKEASIAVLTDYSGTDVEALTELRKKLREENVEYRVVKNTLAKIAVKGTDLENLADDFKGPVGVAFGFGDPVAAPRVLVDYVKKNKSMVLKVASMAGDKFGLDKIKVLAELPSRDQMLGQIAGMMQAPVQNMMNCLVGVPRGFVNCLNALKEQKESGN